MSPWVERGSVFPSRWRQTALGLALLAVTAVAYTPSLSGEFQFDDTPVLERLERGDVTLGKLLHGQGGDRPLTSLTLLANYEVAGLEVGVFHATNILFHLLTVTLIFLLSRATLERLAWPTPGGIATAVAGLFALHPLQTQAVSYVVQRSEILVSLAYVATLLLLLASEPPAPRWRRVVAYVGAVVTFLLGLTAKQVIVTVPFAYVVHRAFFQPAGAPTRWGPVVARAAPLVVVAVYVASTVIRGTAGREDVGFDVPLLSPARYALTQLAVLPTYLRLLAWPAGQNIDHDFPLSAGVTDPRTLAGAAALATVVGVAAWFLLASRSWRAPRWTRSARAGAFGAAWFLLLLAPTSTVVPLADVLVEHRVYLASWGIFLGIATVASTFLAGHVPPTHRRMAAGALVVIAWGALFTVTWQRNEVWGSRLALWADAAQKSPQKARARANHAHALRKVGRPQEAVAEYVAALRLVGEKPELLRGLGEVLYEAGRVDEAIGALERSLALAPGDSRTLSDLAVGLATARRFGEAERVARQAVAADPRNALAHLTLGNIRLEQGDPQAALASYTAAEALAPHLGTPALNAALAHARSGDQAAACAALERYRRMRKADASPVPELFRQLGCERPARPSR
jgi:protein O-mannosyl-transferase